MILSVWCQGQRVLSLETFAPFSCHDWRNLALYFIFCGFVPDTVSAVFFNTCCFLEVTLCFLVISIVILLVCVFQELLLHLSSEWTRVLELSWDNSISWELSESVASTNHQHLDLCQNWPWILTRSPYGRAKVQPGNRHTLQHQKQSSRFLSISLFLCKETTYKPALIQ